MKPGDLIRLNNQGNWTRVIPDMHPRPLEMVIDCVNESGNYALYDESMDGDFDTAMASAGFGTDEDYGYFGD